MSSIINVTENAINKIVALKNEEKIEPFFFRIAINGGGCSGFKYHLHIDDKKDEDDQVFADYVIVDSTSLELLNGSTIDYVEDLSGSSFVIKNPNAQSSCGCGNSFN